MSIVIARVVTPVNLLRIESEVAQWMRNAEAKRVVSGMKGNVYRVNFTSKLPVMRTYGITHDRRSIDTRPDSFLKKEVNRRLPRVMVIAITT